MLFQWVDGMIYGALGTKRLVPGLTGFVKICGISWLQ